MTWSSTGYVLAAARVGQWTAASFAVDGTVHAGCVIAGAQRIGVPLIVQVAAEEVDDAAGRDGRRWRIPVWAAQCVALAEAADVPVALHLVAPPSRGLMRQAVDAGFSSVAAPDRGGRRVPDLEATRRFAWWAHEEGLLAEVRFGRFGESRCGGGGGGGGGSGGGSFGWRAAVRFAAATEIDLLSVGAGRARAARARGHAAGVCASGLDFGGFGHGFGDGFDGGLGDDFEFGCGCCGGGGCCGFDAIAELRDVLPVPLGLHDAVGVPEDQLVKGLRQGVVKLEVARDFGDEYARAVRALSARERGGGGGRTGGESSEGVAVTAATVRLLAGWGEDRTDARNCASIDS